MKIKIKDLGFYQKLFSEAIKYPMKMDTAETLEKFLKATDEIVKQALEDFGMEDKKKAIVEELNKEVAEKFEARKEEKIEDMDEFKRKIAEEVRQTTAAEKEKELNAEFMEVEVDINPIDYVLDESLPGMFNITMRDDKLWVINFKKKASKWK